MTKKLFLNSSFEEKGVKANKRGLKIAGYANTVDKDRAGDIIHPKAWAKGIDNYRKNPVLLFQHKHDKPIGRVDEIRVDKKGLYIEASVSDAAERSDGIQTLIKDGALKSFSVGFQAKNGSYDPKTDITEITEVELMEISVVSVPCNQESLFSIRKSFDSESEYKEFIKSIQRSEETMTEEEKSVEEVTTNADQIEEEMQEKEVIEETSTKEATVEIEDDSEIEVEEKAEIEVEEKAEESIDTIVKESVEEKAEEITTDEDEKNTEEDDDLSISADPYEPIPFENRLAANPDTLKNSDIVFFNNQMYKVLEIPTSQDSIFKFLKFDESAKDCHNDDVITVTKEEISEKVSVAATASDTDDIQKEEKSMADQVTDVIDLSQVKAEDLGETAATPAASVSEPKVAELVQKTGAAIEKEATAQDLRETSYTPRESEEVAELKAQIAKYSEQIKSMNESKMIYDQQSRATQFSQKEMANAMMLTKLLGKNDPRETRYGRKMEKAITTVDAFLSNFSENMFTEMEQQLVIAPMFNRIAVDARTFRIPVADEDTDGDVAMFKSGTFATGVADATNVPTSNQHTFTAVDITPHKFMATTHLAKDEDEDNVLPLMDFLRRAMTRRMARAIDKSILRGTGALTGFTASPTNAITAGTGYASVIEGITNLTADASLEVSTGSANDKADPTDIASARSTMGKYGLQLGEDLVFVTSIEGYNNLVTTSDFRTVDKFGPNATYLTGSVGAVYGIPIVVSEFLDNVGSTGNHLGVLMYKPGFIIGERRAMEIETEYEPRQQVNAMYLSTRFDFKALTTNASAALDTSKYSYAVTVKAG